ncbi:MAG: hypothetical protein JO230_03925, partial [Xanthobacteraceae bacterium]|nr:hypothetical protein [Xanthobacteraceae bacterium]
AAGLGCLAFAGEAHAFSPWAMALPFAVGQFYLAVVLYFDTGVRGGES